MAKVSLRAYNREIETMIDRTHLDEAIAHCQSILKTFPKHLETYRLLGKAYLEAKRYNEAVDIFSRVLVAAPSDFVSQVGMSIIRDEQDKLDDAIWHMERAFETQPSNAAIQSELQRLYGRRDGVQPPRIRMTRGALAHMYMQGELYPQVISETKSVLEEDQGRTDMQILLALAYFRSGQKNDAVDTASLILRRYPYSLDANRILTDVLGADRPESAQTYRKRVIELDPYAGQVDGSVFESEKVSDAAVMLDHFEWQSQPEGVPAGWATAAAIGLGAGLVGQDRDEQPDWLKNALPEGKSASGSMPAFASDQESSSSPKQDEEIPDFLRAAGWGQATGAFDESKSSTIFAEETASAEPLAQGDLPDWVKAMAPQETVQPADEEMPDWISKIGTNELPVSSAPASTNESLDWLNQAGVTSDQGQSEEQPDWLNKTDADGLSIPGAAAATAASLAWLSQADVNSDQQQLEEQPDWIQNAEQALPDASTEAPPDWLQSFGGEQSAPDSNAQPDWIQGLGEEQPAATSDGGPVWLPEPQTIFGGESMESAQPAVPQDTGNLGTSAQEQDDAFAWLEGLAAKQGATEGLLTKPEERIEEEPEWIKQAKQTGELSSPPPSQPEPEAQTPPSSGVEELGKSTAEQDDSFAWLEALAAKQGATEGLLTKPEERREEEPDWVNAAKAAAVVGAVDQIGDLGKKDETEQDDSFAWLEGLAAKQGATEGLLTKPEERLEEAPDWVTQSMDSGEQATESFSMPEELIAEESLQAEDVPSWLKGMDEGKVEEFAAEEDTTSWLKSLDEEEGPVTPSESETMPAWMQDSSEEKVGSVETAVPSAEAEISDWLTEVEEPTAEAEIPSQGKAYSEELPGWLSDLDKEEEEASKVSNTADLPQWMRDETGEVVAEPTKIEPTRSTDWHPVTEEKVDETPLTEPEPAPEPKPEPKKKSAPRKPSVQSAQVAEPVAGGKIFGATALAQTSADGGLELARTELSRSNIPGALDGYSKLIKKGRFLDEVIYDLRDALYRYPVEVSIWQTLGDAYMRANRLQDALDAYTKAEELLR